MAVVTGARQALTTTTTTRTTTRKARRMRQKPSARSNKDLSRTWLVLKARHGEAGQGRQGQGGTRRGKATEQGAGARQGKAGTFDSAQLSQQPMPGVRMKNENEILRKISTKKLRGRAKSDDVVGQTAKRTTVVVV